MSAWRRLLVIVLFGILAFVVVREVYRLVHESLLGVDIEIPLRAAQRWLNGQPPYLASAFQEHGANLPFLYPPVMLPFYAVLTVLPRTLVHVLAVAAMTGAAVAACRRLAVPWIWVPLLLLWPPFFEGIDHANIQVALFAAFVYLFFAPGGTPWDARPRNIRDPATSGLMVGGLATLIAVVKVSQPHPWVYALRHRPKAAIAGLAGAALVVAVTLALTGLALWFSWIAQLRLAGDPAWPAGGFALSRYLPTGVGLAVAVLSVVAVPFIPRRSAGAWIGLLSVIGSLSLHMFGMLFLLPAMLRIPREIALLVAILIATYSHPAIWVAVGICTVAFIVSTDWPNLRAIQEVGERLGLTARRART